MIDMMGDMFDPSPFELTKDKNAILKQQQTIEKVHELGGEVLISSHTWVYMTTDEVLRHTKELEERGADFVKIAMCVNSKEEAVDAIKTTFVVSEALKIPFLHICMGQYGKLHRAISPLFGSCFALCVQQYTEAGHKEKPLLRAEKAVFDNVDYMMARRAFLSTE
jgi:3-dehydroquinate dehydratase type I